MRTMTKDAALVHALLRTLNDWIAGPTTWTRNPLCSRPDSGEAPSTTVQCETCQGHGHRGKTPCAPCHGTGQITVDAYTERAVSTQTQHVTRIRLVKCDSCAGHGAHGNGRRCWHCDGTGQRNAPDTELTFEATSRSVSTQTVWISDRKARQYATGSYAELEDALTALQHGDPNAYRTILCCVVYDEPRIVSESQTSLITATCEWLAHYMPKPIRCPASAKTDTPRNRTQHIQQLRAQGLTLDAIGQHVGLTKQRVGQILREEAA